MTNRSDVFKFVTGLFVGVAFTSMYVRINSIEPTVEPPFGTTAIDNSMFDRMARVFYKYRAANPPKAEVISVEKHTITENSEKFRKVLDSMT